VNQLVLRLQECPRPLNIGRLGRAELAEQNPNLGAGHAQAKRWRLLHPLTHADNLLRINRAALVNCSASRSKSTAMRRQPRRSAATRRAFSKRSLFLPALLSASAAMRCVAFASGLRGFMASATPPAPAPRAAWSRRW